MTPVRLNPDERGEVVWASRIDPVRARIENIPFAESGFHLGDIVLHDGAAVGHRVNNGHEYPVFNVLELFTRSVFNTCIVIANVADPADFEVLDRIFSASKSQYENWTSNVRTLCRQCSEGKPHDSHDHDLSASWAAKHRLGVAMHPEDKLQTLLDEWCKQSNASVKSIEERTQGSASET